MHRPVGTALLIGCLVIPVLGQTAPDAENRAVAVRIDEAPRIDGVLDEAIWQEIEPIIAFTQVWPHDGAPPTEHSEVRIAYNPDYLFFAFTFKDREPHLIRAKNLERGGRNDRDDHAYIALDTYLDKRNAYLFEMNALGTQDDATITDESLTIDSFSWDAVFRSETVISDEGWTMEVSIPFRQLRFPKGDDLKFGLMLSRMINRKNERIIWPAIGLEFGGQFRVLAAVSQYGTLEGLKGIRRGRNLEIKPYVITGLQATRSDPASGQLQQKFTRDLGLDFKYGITSNFTLDLSVNTDFAQVESDNVEINLTRFSLFFPEKREFFLERSGLFEHGNPRTTQTFFSRRIGLANRMLVGARLTGQVGPLSVGLMNIETGGALGDAFSSQSTNNTVARARVTLSPRATAGAIFTNREWTVPDADIVNRRNTAVGADAQVRFWSSSEVSGWLTYANDYEPDKDGLAGHASLRLLNDTYGAAASFTSVGADYNPGLGFVRRRDQRRYNGSAQYTPVVDVASLPFLRQLTFEGDYIHITGQDGALQSSSASIAAGASFHRRDGFELGVDRQFERLDWDFAIRPDVVIPIGDYTFTEVAFRGMSDSSRPFYASAQVSTGGFFSGNRTDVGGMVGARFSRFLSAEVDLTRSWIELPVQGGSFNATTVSLSALSAVSRKLFATALVQYDNFTRELQANIRVNWIHTPGSDLFFVFNTAYAFPGTHDDQFDPRHDPTLLSRVAVAKVTYLILL